MFAVLSTLLWGAVGYSDEEFRTKVRRRLEGTERPLSRPRSGGARLRGQPARRPDPVQRGRGHRPAGYDPGLITDVVGALERYAYTTQGYGGVAYIHAPIEVAAFAAEAGLVLPESTPDVRKVTPLGSIWAFGAYPAGSIIVTGQTTVWRAPEIEVVDSFDTTTNERLLIAERAYAVAFECFAGEATFDPLEAVSP